MSSNTKNPNNPGTLSIQMPDEDRVQTISARELIVLKKEAKLKAEEQELTFKPQLIERRGRPKEVPSGGDVSRFDRLYSDALKRHLEDKYKESVDDKEMTFKPKLVSRSRSSSRERSAPVPVERLHSTPTGKVKAPVVEVKPTFKPTISKRANSIERTRGETADNLYAHSKTAKELQSMLKAEADEKLAGACTFTPQTNIRSRPPSRGRGMDLNQRMDKFEQLKAAKIEAAKQNQLEKEKAKATFTPTLSSKGNNSRSSTPTGAAGRPPPVYARLNAMAPTSPAGTSLENRNSKKYEAEMTFQPQIFSKRAPSPRNPKAGDVAGVHERLFIKGQERKKQGEIEREQIKQENESQLTFQPVINKYKLRGGGDEDPESSPVFERLIVKGNTKQIMQNVLAKLKTELELKDCTFKPTLVSQDPRRKDNVQELDPSNDTFLGRMAAEKEKLRYELKVLSDQRRQEEMEGVTFAPAINPMSAAIVALKRGPPEDSKEGDVYNRLNLKSVRSTQSMDGGGGGDGASYHGSQASSVYGGRGVTKEEPKYRPVLTEAEREATAERLNQKTTRSRENFVNNSSEANTPLPEDALPINPLKVLTPAEQEQIAARLFVQRTATYHAHHEEEPGGGSDVRTTAKIVLESEATAISDRLSMKRTSSYSQKVAPVEEVSRVPAPQRAANGHIIVAAPKDSLVSLSTPRAKSPKADRDPAVFDGEARELKFPGSPSSSRPSSPSNAPSSSSPSSSRRLLARANSSGSTAAFIAESRDKPIKHVFDFSEMEDAVVVVGTSSSETKAAAVTEEAEPAVVAAPAVIATDSASTKSKKKKNKKGSAAAETSAAKKLAGGGKKVSVAEEEDAGAVVDEIAVGESSVAIQDSSSSALADAIIADTAA